MTGDHSELLDYLDWVAGELPPKSRRPTRRYTDDELATAFQMLKQDNVILRDVAEFFDRPQSSLSTRLTERYGDDYSTIIRTGIASEYMTVRLKRRGSPSIETRESISATLTGQPNGWAGRKHTPESIKKIRIAKSNPSLETRERNAAAARGRKQSPDTIAKKTAKQTGQKRSVQQRANMSASQCGKKKSAERRAAMRLTAAGLKAVITPDGEFPSISLAAEHHGVIRRTVCNRIKAGENGWRYAPKKGDTG